MRAIRYAISFALACALTHLLEAMPAQAQSDARLYDDCNYRYEDNPALAISACSDLIARKRDKDGSYYSKRGQAYVYRGEYDRAIADYSKAIKLRPNDSFYYTLRGHAYFYRNEYDLAIADYSRAIKLKSPYVYMDRGYIYIWKKDFDRAVSDFSEAIRLGKLGSLLFLDASFYSARCLALGYKGAYERAIADCNEALALTPTFARAYSNRGFVYIQKGDYDKAIVDLNEAIRLEPTAIDYRNRGTAYTRKGDFDRALADFNEAIRLDPTAARVYARRGQMWEAKGERQKAIDDYVKALSLPTSSLFVRDDQADARRRLAALNAVVSVPPPKLTLDPMPPPKAPPPLSLTPEPKLSLGAPLLAPEPKFPLGRPLAPEPKLSPGASLIAPEPKLSPGASLIAPEPKLATPEPAPPPMITTPQPKPTAPPPKVATEVTPPPSPPPSMQLGRRVALAIGNAAYRKVDPLPNPRKDAADIAAALKATGFAEVVVHHDLGLKEMQRALAAFEEKAARAEWAVVYYGGHAIQVDGKNYLVPVDAELKAPSDVEDETLVLDRVLARIAAAGKLRLVILDACRTNPFRRFWDGAKPRDIAERGLTRYETKQRNLLIAYAAAEGQVALDGPSGGNSPYVKALLKHLVTPGLEIDKLFRLVGDEVMQETAGKQQPFQYGSRSSEDLFFRAASK